MNYDAIVIGSGIGGLSCAGFLSLFNQKVLLVEGNPTLGGCMQPISLKGNNGEKWQWNLGLQWICKFGKLDPDGIMLHALTKGSVRLNKLDTQFQFMTFPDRDNFKFTVVSDLHKMEHALIDAFPMEKHTLREYYRYVRDINDKLLALPAAKMFPIHKAVRAYPKLIKFSFPILSKKLEPFTEISLKEVVENKIGIRDEKLLAILYSYWHFLGMGPEDIPFLFYAVVVGLQEGGVYYPKGGAGAIIDGIEQTIKSKGGQVIKGSPVKQIIVDNGQSKGVILEDNSRYESTSVVSSIGIHKTIDLVPETQRTQQLTQIKTTVDTTLKEIPSILLLRIGLDGDISSAGIKMATYRTIVGQPWLLEDNPLSDNWIPKDVTINFPSYYDTQNLTSGLHTAEVVYLTKYDYFKKYESLINNPTPPKTLEEEYNQDVEKMSNTLQQMLLSKFPKLEPHIKKTMLTTPIDVASKTGHRKGTVYGLDINKAKDMTVQTHSGVEGLYFCGEDIFSQGITTTNGMLTAGALLDSNIFHRIKHLT